MSATHLQLEGPDLEGLLARVRAEHGDEARIIRADRVRSGGIAGFFARERYQLTVAVEARTQPAGQPAAPRTLLDLADAVSAREAAEPAAAAGRRHRATAGAPVSTDGAAFAEVLSRLQREVADIPLAPAAGAAPVDAADDQDDPAPVVPLQRHPREGTQPALTQPAGTRPVPRAAQVPDPGEDLEEMLAWIRTLPAVPAPRYGAGQVVAVLGALPQALEVATVLGRQCGLTAASVLAAVPGDAAPVSARRRLGDPVSAASRRTRLARLAHATVVAVDAGLHLRPEGWVEDMLQALSPAFTWGVVDATAKVTDVVRWAAAVGGVDALALENAEASGDPEAVLAARIPVGMIDGRRATPAAWAALVGDRGAPARSRPTRPVRRRTA